MHPLASPAGQRLAAASGIGAAVLLLAGACSRAPGPPAAAGAGSGSGPAPPTAADAHLAQGEEARAQEKYDIAREELETARALFERDQNWEGYVRAQNGLGATALRQGDHKAALECLNLALATAEERLARSHPETARSYQELGKVYLAAGESKKALELLAQALSLRRAAGGEPADEVAEILMRMAFARTNLGQDDQALGLLDQAEALLRKERGRFPARLADVLIGRGAALWGQGRFDSAIAVYEQAIATLEAEGGGAHAHGRSLAAAYLNLANVYWSKSDYDEALIYYGRALPLQIASLGDKHPSVGTAYMNLAILQLKRGDHEAAIAESEKALGILVPTLGERSAEVVQTYNVLGSAYSRKGDINRALAILEKGRLLQASLPEEGDRNSAVLFSSLADAYRTRGDFARAERYLRQALVMDVSTYGERHPDVAEDFVSLGDLYLAKGDPSRALRFFTQAIEANAPPPSRVDPDLAPPSDGVFSEEFLLEALKGAARARARRGLQTDGPGHLDLEQASEVYANAAALIARMRAGYRAEGSKLSLAAGAGEIFDEALRTEVRLHRLTGLERHLEDAFRVAEQSKAGILRDALNEAAARSFGGVPEALLERERQLRIDIGAADHELAEGQLDRGLAEARLQDLRERQFSLRREYKGLQQRFEREYPAYYDLKYRFETASPSEIREGVLDEGVALVEYFLGREQVFIFTLTARDLEVTQVAREASLEADLQALQRGVSSRDVGFDPRSAHRLYRTLLGPIEDRIAGKELIIVPDGPLSTLPFEALLEREASQEADPHGLPYLLRSHAVSYAYSATVLLQGLRRQGKRPQEEFVAFAPVFAEGDAHGADAPRPLPASRKEVTDIQELFTRRRGFFASWISGGARIYLGRDATEGRLKAGHLERYRYVHLATHAIVDEEHPGRSRLLLLPEARAGEDGVLHLGEIYDLRLQADLVVLSACDTGRGRIARGEGIIGLTRGFLYAGAQSLLVSLWPLSDAATSDLMVDFYKELLGGRPRAQALREAKLRTMGRHPEYAKPYYWSSLVLVGQRQ